MIKIDKRNLNIFIVQGDTGAFTIGIKKYKFTEGDTINFSVKQDLNPSTPYSIHKTMSSFTEEGRARIVIAPEDTIKLSLGKYYYDIEWTAKDSSVNTIIPCGSAEFRIIPGVTNV